MTGPNKDHMAEPCVGADSMQTASDHNAERVDSELKGTLNHPKNILHDVKKKKKERW